MGREAGVLRMGVGRVGVWRLGVAVIVVISAFAVAPRALAFSWSKLKPVPGGGQFTSLADVAMDAAGDAIVVWSDLPGNVEFGNVKVAFASAGGQFGGTETIGGLSYDGNTPSVAMDARGDAIVVWEDTNGDLVASYRPSGGSFGSPVTVATDMADASTPAVAMDAAGDAFVLYTGQGANPTVEVVQRPAGNSSSFSLHQLLGTGGTAPSDLGVSPNGHAIVTFTSSQGVEAARTAAPGHAFGAPVLVYSSGNVGEVGAAVDDQGDATVGLNASPPSGDDTAYVVNADNGGSFGAPARVGPSGDSDVQAITIDSSRETIAAVDESGCFCGQILDYRSRQVGGHFGAAQTLVAGVTNTGPLTTATDVEGANGDVVFSWQMGNGAFDAGIRPPGCGFAESELANGGEAPIASAIDKLGDHAIILTSEGSGSSEALYAVYGASNGQSLGCPSDNGGSGSSSGRPTVKSLKVKVNHHKHSAVVKFSASSASKLKCALVADKGKHHKSPRYSPCHSPKAYKHLHGHYTFYLKAVNGGGSTVRKDSFSV